MPSLSPNSTSPRAAPRARFPALNPALLPTQIPEEPFFHWGSVVDDPVVRREPYRGGGQPVSIDTTSAANEDYAPAAHAVAAGVAHLAVCLDHMRTHPESTRGLTLVAM
jgi:hypothetical protein